MARFSTWMNAWTGMLAINSANRLAALRTGTSRPLTAVTALLAGAVFLAGPAALSAKADTETGSNTQGATSRGAETTESDMTENAGAESSEAASGVRHSGNDPERLPDQVAAARFLQSLANQAFEILNDETMDSEARHEAFRTVLGEGLAIDIIGRVMLGRHRTSITPEQLATYQAVFPDYITSLYAAQLATIAQKPLEVIQTAPYERNPNDVLVRTRLERMSGEPILIDWRIRKFMEDEMAGEAMETTGAAPEAPTQDTTTPGETEATEAAAEEVARKVIDISVEGISIVRVKRDEFNALIRARGFDALLTELRERSGSLSDVL